MEIGRRSNAKLLKWCMFTVNVARTPKQDLPLSSCKIGNKDQKWCTSRWDNGVIICEFQRGKFDSYNIL